jgi:hypothetical protein
MTTPNAPMELEYFLFIALRAKVICPTAENALN